MIERDEAMDRTYIPLPGGWEIQTKGKGSTFRLCDPQGRRTPVLGEELHEPLERMARDISNQVAVMRATIATLEHAMTQLRGDYDRERLSARDLRTRMEKPLTSGKDRPREFEKALNFAYPK